MPGRLDCGFGLFFAGNAVAQEAAALADLKQQAIQEIDKRQTFTQQMVDQIYSYSELGFQEVETSRYVTGILEKNGFTVERGIAGIPPHGLRAMAAANR